MITVKLDNIYSDRVYFITGCEFRDFESYVNKAFYEPEERTKEEHPPKGYCWKADKDGKTYFYMWVDLSDGEMKSRIRIIHETFHLVYALSEYVGITLTEESEEAFAHLQDNFCEVLFKKLGL